MTRLLALALLLAAGNAAADVKVMVGVDPSDRESMVISLIDLGTTLSRVAGQPVRCYLSQDLGDVMRSTRTGEYEVYIAPAHVAASALSHGYALVGSTDPDEIYELIVRPGTKAPAELQGGKLYLTQQDSVVGRSLAPFGGILPALKSSCVDRTKAWTPSATSVRTVLRFRKVSTVSLCQGTPTCFWMRSTTCRAVITGACAQAQPVSRMTAAATEANTTASRTIRRAVAVML